MAIPQRYALLTEMRLEQTLANYLREILLKSARQIARDIAALGKDDEPLTQMQLNAQMESIQSVLDQDFSSLETAIAQGKIEAAKQASAVVSRYENQLLSAVLNPDAVRRIARGEAQRSVAGLEAALQRMKGRSYKTLSSQVYDTKKLASGWVSDKINQALVSGWDARRLAKEVRQSISPDVPGGVSYAANRLARTEINNAFHAASAERYENSPIVESVNWHLSTSHPEGDICDALAEESPYPKDAVPEKPHPSCYCYITPSLPSKDEFLKNLLAGKYDDEGFSEEVDLQDRHFILRDDMSDEEMMEVWTELGDSPGLTEVYNANGTMRMLPNAVSDEEYHRILSDGGSEIYRGLANSDGLTAKEAMEMFKKGDHYAGVGIYGGGSYFSDTIGQAEKYAGKGGTVGRFVISPSASVISQEEAAQRASETWERMKEAGASQDQLGFISDPGVWAAANGYDAILVDIKRMYGLGPNQYIVLNRSALSYVEA